MKFFRKLRRNEEGATAIEYGLIAALVSVVLITVLTKLGTQLDTKFNSIATAIQDAAPAA